MDGGRQDENEVWRIKIGLGMGLGLGLIIAFKGRLAGRLAVWFNLHGINYQTSIFNISRSIQALYHHAFQQTIM